MERVLIQIDANEDVNAVRDRLSFLRGQRVLLIWPEDGTALTRKLDLVLLQREAMRRAIRLAVVTHDPQIMQNARELNISTFETIGASERGRWKRGRSKVFTARWQRPKEEKEPEELMQAASRVRFKRPALPRLQSLLIRLGILAVITAIIAAIAFVVVPGATVTLVPASQLLEASVQITVNPDPSITNIDVENAVLPSTRLLVQVEETFSTNTTGERALGNVAAAGTVVFINRTQNEVEIPAGTTVSTSAGTPIMFRTTDAATLPPGDDQQVEVPIEAMPGSTGDVGNVGPNLINTVIGVLDSSVSVINMTATTGGQSRTEATVTSGDRERLLRSVRQQIQTRAYEEMQSLINDSQVIILETLRISEERDDWTQFSAEPGEFAETLSLTMRAEVEAIAVNMSLGQQIVFARMNSQNLRGRSIVQESISYRQGDVVIAGNLITFTMSGTARVVGNINVDQIREQLAGRSLEEAQNYLTTRVDLHEDFPPKIALSVDWLEQMPLLPMRITIVTTEAPAT